jgi:hypothetical protein
LTHKEYDAILDELRNKGKLLNEKRPSHVSFQKDDKWCVVDVWESEEDFMEFGTQHLMPIFSKMGLRRLQPRIFPAHHYIGIAAEEFISA